MKRRSSIRYIAGLLIATAFFAYCGAHVLIKEIGSPSIGHYFGACLVPGIFLILLVREVLAARSERQRTLDNKTTGDGSPKPSM
jgi:hypothetical protein